MWFDTFNAVFFTGIATMAFGGLAVCLRYGFMSKCDNIQLCWGAVTVHRAVDLEQKGESDDELTAQQHGSEEEKSVEISKHNSSFTNKV